MLFAKAASARARFSISWFFIYATRVTSVLIAFVIMVSQACALRVYSMICFHICLFLKGGNNCAPLLFSFTNLPSTRDGVHNFGLLSKLHAWVPFPAIIYLPSFLWVSNPLIACMSILLYLWLIYITWALWIGFFNLCRYYPPTQICIFYLCLNYPKYRVVVSTNLREHITTAFSNVRCRYRLAHQSYPMYVLPHQHYNDQDL